MINLLLGALKYNIKFIWKLQEFIKIKNLEKNEIWKDYNENNHNDIQAFDITTLNSFF